MNLQKLDEVTALKNHRAKAIELHRAASSELIDLRVGNQPVDAFTIISAEPVRAAVRDACQEFIVETESKLRALGVYVENPHDPLEGTAEQWRRCADQYANAWRRELGQHIAPKRHLIDALVVGTRNLVARVTGNAA